MQYHSIQHENYAVPYKIQDKKQFHAVPYGAMQSKSDFVFFGQKWALATPQEPAEQHEQHENIVFLVIMVTKKLEDVHKKIIAGQKTAFFGPKRATLGNRCQK